MSHAAQVAEFYQQLALLLRSNLPLPESLLQLGRHLPSRNFQAVVRQLAGQAARGDRFADLLRRHPECFDPFHVRLIAAGESSGTLPEVLFAVARSARFAQLLTSRIRDLMAYPLLTIHLGGAIFFVVSVLVISGYHEVFTDLLEGRALPPLTTFVLGIAEFLRDHCAILGGIYLAVVLGSVWLFCPFRSAHRALLAVINALPGSLQVVQSLDSSRLCNMLSVFLRLSTPLPAALAAVAELVERRALRGALARTGRSVERGAALADALAAEPAIDPLIALTFRHTPEADVPSELTRLSELFEHRVTLAARSATITWTAFVMAFMILFVGLVVIAMFLPLVSIVNQLSM